MNLPAELRTGMSRVKKRLATTDGNARRIVNAYHQLFYYRLRWQRTSWLGVPTLKCPLDLWIYQEILFETRPDLVIETGTAHGGSALFLASMLDLLGGGRVITVDLYPRDGRPSHPRLTYLSGSSTDLAVIQTVTAAATEATRTMVILDSDHSEPHVAGELWAYSPLVSPGCYLIVEDTNVNGHPVLPQHGPGPMEAVEAFLGANHDFAVDPERERYGMTYNPRGYLLRR